MSARWSMAAVAVMTAGLVFGAGVVPAQAATPEILVSSDGVSFAASLSPALFTDIGKLVPQDVETTSFWVRNPLTTAAQMRVSVANLVASSPEIATGLTLTTVDVGNGLTHTDTLADLAKCDVIVSPRSIPAGATIRIDVAIEMLDVGQQIAQLDAADMSFLVGMRDAAAGAFPASACDDVGVAIPAIPPTAPAGNNPGGLIKTGVDLPYDWFAIAAGLVGFGFLMLLRRRRERREES